MSEFQPQKLHVSTYICCFDSELVNSKMPAVFLYLQSFMPTFLSGARLPKDIRKARKDLADDIEYYQK